MIQKIAAESQEFLKERSRFGQQKLFSPLKDLIFKTIDSRHFSLPKPLEKESIGLDMKREDSCLKSHHYRIYRLWLMKIISTEERNVLADLKER